eukprot:TRINITY_DN1410_c0_g2_i1.p1 TRINITY_DN1410_c0_g2~~TRINITY_DN1410_c0_g2_i1.p1  ORF type:complete len:364 (+),score=99.83 TRINITY_DN1410_c0_g2_i1:44-1093(+)
MAVSVQFQDQGLGGMMQVSQMPMQMSMNTGLPLQTHMHHQTIQTAMSPDHFGMGQHQQALHQVPITQMQGQPFQLNTTQPIMQTIDVNHINQSQAPGQMQQHLHLHHHQQQQQQPPHIQVLPSHSHNSPPISPSGSSNATSKADSIKTIFVAGLPHDATDRELYLLFGSCEAYDKSMIVRKDNGKRPYGFVNFTTAQGAEEAKNKLDGFQWNPAEPLKLKIELSRRNTPDWFNAMCASPTSMARRLSSLPKNPKTLYITGVPETVSKELFDAFITTNFEGQVSGLRYTPPTEKKTSFAFIGFNTHEQAKTAMERLDGYVWTHEGVQSTIHATPANTEWDPRSTRNATNS